ncbi:isovaleryl-CoA dehydrogenase [Hydrogenophaga sp. NFH-34]|uniref:isovaleryl-CoA dehydrogenase n=1 Tax=Hydrogenophaga sp. NFH-34 TaxID=2744446 RepID=UPI001F411A28|nr:isovaleryl-CoA dehydrogenase [Hydrogenophaga sp. NFH-34]
MGWTTHEVSNQFDELRGYNLYTTDSALQAAVSRHGGADAHDRLAAYGELMGTAESYDLADLANRHTPELRTFDARGRRIDQVDFHPAWHELLSRYRGAGLISSPFRETHTGRWAAWAAGFYLHAQIEAGTLCPSTMTLGAIPLLQREPALWEQTGSRLFSDRYDPRDLPIAQKSAIYLGMGMTEKQGGSDVRANQTTATPIGAGGRGGEYLLRGHKWFFSAPMCDAHLVVARTPEDGLACFFVPRWRPDGSKNAIHIQRLKNKVGNKSNSSSEVEFHDAWGVLMGEAGRGIPTIIEMATYTRLTCVLGSAAMIRQALAQGIAYTRQRRAFGNTLANQPLMRAVLADMALESEGALALAMHLAEAYEHDTPEARAWHRLMTPAAKFWVCKRAVELTGEAMEVFGGNGYVEDGIMGRLFREAPVNSIWEGSGNVMCLDVMRGIARQPEHAQVLLADLMRRAGEHRALTSEALDLSRLLERPPGEFEGIGRQFTARLCVLAQACLLHESAPTAVADAFIATRLGTHWGAVTGLVDPSRLDVDALLQRALPA